MKNTKKQYTSPEFETVLLSLDDVLTASKLIGSASGEADVWDVDKVFGI